MRKIWTSQVFLLCMMCLIFMQGLCMAKFIKDDDGNWVEYYRENEKPWNIYFIDTNVIKVREYEGKKYLEVSIRRKEEDVEGWWLVQRVVEVTNAKFHGIYDLENQKRIFLTYENKYAKEKRGQNDISEIANGFDWMPWEKQLVSWVEQNYPAVINEIRTFNRSGQSAGKTDVTGAANVPSGGTPNISAGNIPERNANIHPGAVEFRPMGWDEDGFVAIWKNPPGRLGGEYAIRNGNYMNGRHGTDSEGMNFDVIGWDDDGNPNEFLVCSVAGLELGYSCRVKVINHTSVKIDWLETSYQDWKRKRENPASEAPSPILKTASSECPHPIETYSLQSVGTVRMSELERVNENFPYLFVSEYGFYQVNVSYQNWPKTEGYLNHVFYGPMAEALIAFGEAGGEVEDYPADAGNIVYELGN